MQCYDDFDYDDFVATRRRELAVFTLRRYAYTICRISLTCLENLIRGFFIVLETSLSPWACSVQGQCCVQFGVWVDPCTCSGWTFKSGKIDLGL